MSVETIIKPRRIAIALTIISVYLATQSIFGEFINTTILHNQYNSVPSLLLDEFSVNAEQTIPTWYQVILLFPASVLLGLIARAKSKEKARFSRYWFALAGIFLYLSIDEAASIHEIFSEPLHQAFHTTGVLSFGWQLAAAPLLVIFGLLFLRFLLHLPSRTRNLLILAGILYVGGAFGIDAISAGALPSGGELTLPYLALGTVEELFEMAGQVMLVYTLLSYIREMQYRFVFQPPLALPSVGGELTGAAAVTHNTSKKTLRLSHLVRWGLLVGILIVLINAGLVYWAVTQQSGSTTVAAVNPIPVYQSIIEGFPADNILVTHMRGLFGSDDPATEQFAATLLTQYADVMVVTVPSASSTVFLAGDTLPFDREALSNYLLDQGEVEFIIYDTSAVKSRVTSDLPPN
jgi:hypothetical protein